MDRIEAPIPAAIRRERIVALIRDQDFARVSDLSDQFGISEVTIRADLHHLERGGKVRRVHGGAVPRSLEVRAEPTFEQAAGASAGEKAAIGRHAAAMVRPGETVIIDVGTTSAALAAALIDRADLEEVVVITNSLNIALQLERTLPRFSVVVTGGTLRPRQHSLVEPYASLLLAEFHADVFFLGCNGIQPVAGVTNINLPEAQVKHRMLEAARRIVVIADGSKVGEISTARVCSVEDVDLLITGSSAAQPAIAELAELGLAIDVAGDSEN